MSESTFTARLTAGLRRVNARVLVMHQGTYSTPGAPDRYVCHRRWAGWLEMKDTRTRLRPEQRALIRDMNDRRPGTAYVVRSPGTVEDHEGNVLAEFDGTAVDLLVALEELGR